MGRKKLGRERISVTLPPGMAKALARAAQERGWDRSRLVEEIVAKFLADEKGRPKGGAS